MHLTLSFSGYLTVVITYGEVSTRNRFTCIRVWGELQALWLEAELRS